MLLTDGRPHFRFFFLWLPFFPFLHLLAEATGPVFELAGIASVPPARAATSAASVILLINTDTPIDSACGRPSQACGGALDRSPDPTIEEKMQCLRNACARMEAR